MKMDIPSFIVVVVLPLLIIASIVFKGIKSLMEWHNNNNSPCLNIGAKIVARRTENCDGYNTRRRNRHEGRGITIESNVPKYYITFELETGERKEMSVPRKSYGLLVEGDVGSLTYQGTRYIDFKRQIV